MDLINMILIGDLWSFIISSSRLSIETLSQSYYNFPYVLLDFIQISKSYDLPYMKLVDLFLFGSIIISPLH